MRRVRQPLVWSLLLEVGIGHLHRLELELKGCEQVYLGMQLRRELTHACLYTPPHSARHHTVTQRTHSHGRHCENIECPR